MELSVDACPVTMMPISSGNSALRSANTSSPDRPGSPMSISAAAYSLCRAISWASLGPAAQSAR